MATPSEMVTALETALSTNAGVVSITVDGQSVRYDRKQALEELRYWKREASKASRKRPVASQINLGGAW